MVVKGQEYEGGMTKNNLEFKCTSVVSDRLLVGGTTEVVIGSCVAVVRFCFTPIRAPSRRPVSQTAVQIKPTDLIIKQT